MSVDAIVVLGCRIAADGVLAGASLRRVQRAADAYRQGLAPWVVASGGRRWHGVAEAEAYRSALIDAGVPATRTLMELCSLSTGENAAYVAALFRARGWRSAALVSCDWHLPRARACFERAGIACHLVPAPTPTSPLWVRGYRALRERVSFWIDGSIRVEGYVSGSR